MHGERKWLYAKKPKPHQPTPAEKDRIKEILQRPQKPETSWLHYFMKVWEERNAGTKVGQFEEENFELSDHLDRHITTIDTDTKESRYGGLPS